MFFTNLKIKTTKIWEFLKGGRAFSLQSRIYNSICVITTAVMLYNIPFSIAIGLNEATIATTLLIPVQLYLYYLSRFKRKTNLSFTIYAIIVNLFFAVSYTLNAGIQGSSLLSFSISYFAIIAIVPRRHYWLWTILNISLVMGLIIWEYQHPEIVQNNYLTRADHFVDIASTYIVNIILTFACLSYIINNYNLERQIAESNASILAELNKQKNDLISIISHDFNAPLNNINNYLYILSNKDLEDEVKKSYEKELGRITFDTQNLLLNLLNWAKSNMDGMNYDLEPVNIQDSMADTLNVYRNIAAEKNIILDYKIPEDITVIANFEMVEIIFRNLISNAVKFTPVNGSISILSETLNGYHVISIMDTGLGIPLEKQPYIFKADVSATYGTGRERGVGLGLKICDEFIQSLDGDIWFSTEVGIGTTFFVKFAMA